MKINVFLMALGLSQANGSEFYRPVNELAPEINKGATHRHVARRATEEEEAHFGFVINFNELRTEAAKEDFKVFEEFISNTFENFSCAYLVIPNSVSEDVISEIRQKTYVASIEHELAYSSRGLYWSKGRIGTVDNVDDGYTGNVDYEGNGHGTHIYILDSGIDDHPEFGLRIDRDLSTGFGFRTDSYDCLGHGTQVASVAAGNHIGIANKATLVSFAMLDCDNRKIGQSSVLLALERVLYDMNTYTKISKVVVNLSLGPNGEVATETSILEAEASLAAKGAVIVRAAGNNQNDACLHGQNGMVNSLSVGSSTAEDKRAEHSNYGSCVDIFAPGENVTMAYYEPYSDSSKAYGWGTGTSYAAPMVSGAAAVIMTNQGITGQAVMTALLNQSSKNKLSGSPSVVNNKLLYLKPVKLFHSGNNKLYRYVKTSFQSYVSDCTLIETRTYSTIEECAARANLYSRNTFEYLLYKSSSNCVIKDCGLVYEEKLDTNPDAVGGVLLYTDIRNMAKVKDGFILQPGSYSTRRTNLGCDGGNMYTTATPSLEECMVLAVFASASIVNFELSNNTCALVSCPSNEVVEITTAHNTWVSYKHHITDDITVRTTPQGYRFVPTLRKRILSGNCIYRSTTTQNSPALCSSTSPSNSNAFQWNMNGQCEFYDCQNRANSYSTIDTYHDYQRSDHSNQYLTYVHSDVVPQEYLGFSIYTQSSNRKLACDSFKTVLQITLEDCAFYTLSSDGNAFNYRPQTEECQPAYCTSESSVASSENYWFMYINHELMQGKKSKYIVHFNTGTSSSQFNSFLNSYSSMVSESANTTLNGVTYREAIVELENISDLINLKNQSDSIIQNIERDFDQSMTTELINFESGPATPQANVRSASNKNKKYDPNFDEVDDSPNDYVHNEGEKVKATKTVTIGETENNRRRRSTLPFSDEEAPEEALEREWKLNNPVKERSRRTTNNVPTQFTRSEVMAVGFEIFAPFTIVDDYVTEPYTGKSSTTSLTHLKDGVNGYMRYPFYCSAAGTASFTFVTRQHNVDHNSIFAWVGHSLDDFNQDTTAYSTESWEGDMRDMIVAAGMNYLYISAREQATQIKSVYVLGCQFASSPYAQYTSKDVSATKFQMTGSFFIEQDYVREEYIPNDYLTDLARLESGSSGYLKRAFWCDSAGSVDISVTTRQHTVPAENSIYMFVGDTLSSFSTARAIYTGDGWDTDVETFTINAGVNYLWITSREKGTHIHSASIGAGCLLQTESCYDGLLNQDETDIDCGGSCPSCSTQSYAKAYSRTQVSLQEMEFTTPFFIEETYVTEPFISTKTTLARIKNGDAGYVRYPFYCESAGTASIGVINHEYLTANSFYVFVGDSIDDYTEDYTYYSSNYWRSSTKDFTVKAGVNYMYITSREPGTKIQAATITGCKFASSPASLFENYKSGPSRGYLNCPHYEDFGVGTYDVIKNTYLSGYTTAYGSTDLKSISVAQTACDSLQECGGFTIQGETVTLRAGNTAIAYGNNGYVTSHIKDSIESHELRLKCQERAIIHSLHGFNILPGENICRMKKCDGAIIYSSSTDVYDVYVRDGFESYLTSAEKGYFNCPHVESYNTGLSSSDSEGIIQKCKDRVMSTGTSGFNYQNGRTDCFIKKCTTDEPIYSAPQGTVYNVYINEDDFKANTGFTTGTKITMNLYDVSSFEDKMREFRSESRVFGSISSETLDVINGGKNIPKFQEHFGFPAFEGRYGYQKKEGVWDFKGITDEFGAYSKNNAVNAKPDFYASHDDYQDGMGAFDQNGGWGTFDQNGGWGIFDQNGGFGQFDQNGAWGIFDQNGGYGTFDQNGGWGTFDQLGGWDAADGKRGIFAGMLPGTINEFDPTNWIFDASDSSFTLDSFDIEQLYYQNFVQVGEAKSPYKFIDTDSDNKLLSYSGATYTYDIDTLEDCTALVSLSHRAFSYSPAKKVCITANVINNNYALVDGPFGFLNFVSVDLKPDASLGYKISPFGLGITVKCENGDEDRNIFDGIISLEACLGVGSRFIDPFLYYNSKNGECTLVKCVDSAYVWEGTADLDLDIYVKDYVPVDAGVLGGWTAWSGSWSLCTKTCGGGTQNKYRVCDSLLPDTQCPSNSGGDTKTQSCNTQTCGSCSVNREAPCATTGFLPNVPCIAGSSGSGGCANWNHCCELDTCINCYLKNQLDGLSCTPSASYADNDCARWSGQCGSQPKCGASGERCGC